VSLVAVFGQQGHASGWSQGSKAQISVGQQWVW